MATMPSQPTPDEPDPVEANYQRMAADLEGLVGRLKRVSRSLREGGADPSRRQQDLDDLTLTAVYMQSLVAEYQYRARKAARRRGRPGLLDVLLPGRN